MLSFTDLMHGSSPPPKSTSQTASRLVQLFQHSLWFSQKESDHATSITYAESRVLLCTAIRPENESAQLLLRTTKVPLPWVTWPHRTNCFSATPKWYIDWFSHFCSDHARDQQKDRPRYTSSSGLHLVLQAVLSILLAYSTCLQCFDTKVTGHCIQKSHHLLPAYPGCPNNNKCICIAP